MLNKYIYVSSPLFHGEVGKCVRVQEKEEAEEASNLFDQSFKFGLVVRGHGDINLYG